jgi:hypothetical protein
MIEQLIPILLVFLVVGLIWTLIKFVLKLTAKIFSCGCLVIILISIIVVVFRGNLPVF